MAPHIRVLLADDSARVRSELKTVLAQESVDIVGEAANGCEAVHLAKAQDVDVAILDLAMPVLDGIQATREILEKSGHTRVLVVSGLREEYQIMSAFHAGAHGFVAKADVGEELGPAITEVLQGHRYLSSAISRTIAGRRLAPSP
jgi:two-component system, NarL family, response regulator NreC